MLDKYDAFEYKYYDFMLDIPYEIASTIKSGEEFKLAKIKPTQYKKALSEFMKYRQLMRFPTKIIDSWELLILRNVAVLDYLTMLFGHTNCFDTDGFNDAWIGEEDIDEYIDSWEGAMNWL